MYIIYVNHDYVIKQICQLRDKAFLINETFTMLGTRLNTSVAGLLSSIPNQRPILITMTQRS